VASLAAGLQDGLDVFMKRGVKRGRRGGRSHSHRSRERYQTDGAKAHYSLG